MKQDPKSGHSTRKDSQHGSISPQVDGAPSDKMPNAPGQPEKRPQESSPLPLYPARRKSQWRKGLWTLLGALVLVGAIGLAALANVKIIELSPTIEALQVASMTPDVIPSPMSPPSNTPPPTATPNWQSTIVAAVFQSLTPPPPTPTPLPRVALRTANGQDKLVAYVGSVQPMLILVYNLNPDPAAQYMQINIRTRSGLGQLTESAESCYGRYSLDISLTKRIHPIFYCPPPNGWTPEMFQDEIIASDTNDEILATLPVEVRQETPQVNLETFPLLLSADDLENIKTECGIDATNLFLVPLRVTLTSDDPSAVQRQYRITVRSEGGTGTLQDTPYLPCDTSNTQGKSRPLSPNDSWELVYRLNAKTDPMPTFIVEVQGMGISAWPERVWIGIPNANSLIRETPNGNVSETAPSTGRAFWPISGEKNAPPPEGGQNIPWYYVQYAEGEYGWIGKPAVETILGMGN